MVRHIEMLVRSEDKGFLLYEGENLPYRNNIRIMHFANYLLQLQAN